MRPIYIKVRARSANEGSGTAGWLLVVRACFPTEEVVMNFSFPEIMRLEVSFTALGAASRAAIPFSYYRHAVRQAFQYPLL